MKNTTTIKIPKKYEHMLELVECDVDGYWAYTNHGFWCPEMDCHTMHEDTQAALLNKIRGIEPCECDDCKKGLAEEAAEVAAVEAVEAPAPKAKKAPKLSATMQKEMDRLRRADWYYMHNGKACGYFVKGETVRSVGFSGTGIVEGGYVYAQMDSKTLEALQVRGLVEVAHVGGNSLDAVKVVGMELPERLTKAIHFRAKRFWDGRLIQDHKECYATNGYEIEVLRQHLIGGKDQCTVEIEVYGEVELTVWDFFANK